MRLPKELKLRPRMMKEDINFDLKKMMKKRNKRRSNSNLSEHIYIYIAI